MCTPVLGGPLLAPLPGRQVDTGGLWDSPQPLTQAGRSLALGEQGAVHLPTRKAEARAGFLTTLGAEAEGPVPGRSCVR